MIINNKNKLIEFSQEILTKKDLEKITIPKGHERLLHGLVKYDNKFYYCKSTIGYYEIINELIGTYLSKLISLDTVDYQVGICDNTMYTLSELLFESNYTYTDCNTYYQKKLFDNIKILRRLLNIKFQSEDINLSQIEGKDMLENVLKLIAVDLKTGQLDRHNNNLMLKISTKDNTVDLAPIYDYGFSYKDPLLYDYKYYINPFIIIKRDTRNISSLIKKYPNIIKYIDVLRNIKIEDVLLDIENEKGISLTKEEVDYYTIKDKEYNKLLLKI